MTLREARCAFTECLALLIGWARLQGYQVALAEGMDRITAKDPTTDHMKGSLHEIGLAQDIDLYIDGIYQSETVAHTALGEYWKDLGVKRGYPLRWGGDFEKADGNHYSWEWGGKA